MILRPSSSTTLRLLLLIAVACYTHMAHALADDSSPESEAMNNDLSNDNDSNNDINPPHSQYTCPHTPSAKSENDFDGYWATYKNMNAHNQHQLDNFRNLPYDQRSDPYWKMKQKSFAFKAAYFGNVIHSGQHMYESACGTGGNLLMTMEILQEEFDITNLTLHGNDYLQESVDLANALLQQEQANNDTAASFQAARLCQGDSTNLQHIPDDSFHVAYTGFIDPILDPLNILGGTASLVETENFHEHLCESASKGNPLHQWLTEQMQQRQEEWHAAWVTELIRITKPGHYIIIEDVGWPGCSELADWAGVDTYWWHRAIAEYQWDVIPESLAIAEKPWYRDRYNVRLRKTDPARPDLLKDTLETNRASWEYWREYKLDHWWDEPEDDVPKDYTAQQQSSPVSQGKVAPSSLLDKLQSTTKASSPIVEPNDSLSNPSKDDGPEPEELIPVPFPGSVSEGRVS